MTVSLFLQLVVQGCAIGAIYGLAALGFVLLVKALDVINFAQGEFVVLGGFIVWTLVGAGLPFWLALPGALLIGALVGVVFERVVYRPIRDRDFATHLIGTLAGALILRNLAQHIWGPETHAFTAPFDRWVFDWHSVVINPQYLLILGATVLLVAGYYVFFFHSPTGKVLRAVADSRSTARLLGVHTNRIGALAFALASSTGVLAGVLVAPLFLVDPNVGFTAALKAFVATIIGGWGSFPGALLGGLIVGLAEVFSVQFFPSGYKDATAFVILIVFLLLRPQGLFPGRAGERA